MANYDNLREEYNALATRVHRALRLKIFETNNKSKFADTVAIKVNIFDYVELAIIDDELIFIDGNGNYHSLYSDCNLEDLIDIVTE